MVIWKRIVRKCISPWLVIWSGRPEGRRVALTFDDGPDPSFTLPVLEVLKKTGAKATFFVVGEKASAYPDLVRQIVCEGHEIGSHSFRHESLGDKSLSLIGEEIRRAEACLMPFEKRGLQSRPFRPPYGVMSLRLLLWMALHRMKIVLWSKDPEDFKCRSGVEILDYFSARPIMPGDIVLLHDKTPALVEALENVIVGLQGRGMKLVRVSELLNWRS